MQNVVKSTIMVDKSIEITMIIKKNSIYIVITLGIIIICTLFFSGTVMANHQSLNKAGRHLNTVTGKAGIQKKEIEVFVGDLIKALLQVVGLIFFILMVYGGFQWLTARGNDEQVTKARDIITAGIIGIFIVVGSYAITNFVISRLTGG